MTYLPTEEDLALLKSRSKRLYCRIELLNKDYQIIDTIEGLALSGSNSIDADSDTRRTFNLDIFPKSGFSISQFSTEEWTSKMLRLQIGMKGKFVTDVTYNAGVLSVAKGDEPVTTTMTGIVHEPTYDAETRTIKLPVFGGDTLTIALGKDLVVKSGIYNTETHEIELTITTGEVIKIPVGSLIDIYVGVATSTATVTVSDDNKISVAVRVSAKANNSITIEDDGLYVAVPDAYTKAETDAKIKKVQDQLDGHSKDAVVHITAEERKAWNAKVSQDELTAAKSEVISAAAADATKKADAARDAAKTYADGLNTAMDNRVKSVEGALTWKAIDDSGANAET